MIKRQSGNVMFIILATIGLIAALTMMLSNSERSSATMGNEKSALQLQQIMNYAANIERGVQRVLVQNNCQIGEMNFDHPDLENYDTNAFYKNPSSPSDKSCDIFDVKGGGVTYQAPPEMSQNVGSNEYGILSAVRIHNIGTNTSASGEELILHTRLDRATCILANNQFGIDNPSGEPPATTGSFTYNIPYNDWKTFPRASTAEGFGSGDNLGDNISEEALAGHKAGCFYAPSESTYNLFYVLLTR